MKRGTFKPSLNMLPYDMLILILSKVALVSHLDLGSAMISCKDMLNASKYPEVIKNICLEDIVPPPFEIVPKCMKLVEECAKHGNIHATFLSGLFNFFHLNNPTVGKNQLSIAAKETHPDSMYVYDMIQLITCEFEEGSNYLTQLWRNQGFDKIRDCHMNVRKVVLEMTVREYREYDILSTLMEIHENCIAGGINEVCEDCFIRKEICRFIDYLN